MVPTQASGERKPGKERSRTAEARKLAMLQYEKVRAESRPLPAPPEKVRAVFPSRYRPMRGCGSLGCTQEPASGS